MDQQRYDEIAQAQDLETFRRLLVGAAKAMEFDLVNVMLGTESGGELKLLVDVGNTPEAYTAAYKDTEIAKRDPVTDRLKKFFIPFAYDQSLFVEAGVPELWEQQASFGYKSGIALSMFLPDNRRLWIGVDRDGALPRESELQGLKAELLMLASYAQAGAQELIDSKLIPAEPIHFTPSEKDVLRWALEQKTNWEISKILGISENTLRFHVKNILRKIGCQTKHEAAVLARAYRLI